MLRKLLKYDFKSIIKLWFILSITVFALSFPIGYGMRVYNSPREIPLGLDISLQLGMTVLIFGLFAYVLLTGILIFKRFYKNFFTDEGYLTFTLPAQRKQLLFSKVLFGTISYSCTIFIFLATLINLICVSTNTPFITMNDIKELIDILNLQFGLGTGVSVLYIVGLLLEIIALFVLANCISVVFLYLCITIASIIAKKNKVLTAVGIYYLSNSVLAFIIMIFSLFGISSVLFWASELNDKQTNLFILLALLLIFLFLATILSVLYFIIYRLIDKKLNLA